MRGWLSKKDRKIRNLETMVKNRDKLIEALQTNRSLQKLNRELLTEQNTLLKIKITDLENNIELLTNNLSAAKKKQLGL